MFLIISKSLGHIVLSEGNHRRLYGTTNLNSDLEVSTPTRQTDSHSPLGMEVYTLAKAESQSYIRNVI